VITMLMVCVTILLVQLSDQKYRERRRKHADIAKLSDTLLDKIKECDEMKKHIDTLILKGNFR